MFQKKIVTKTNISAMAETSEERGGIVEKHRTRHQEFLGLIPTDGTLLCPRARYIYSIESWLISRKLWLSSNMTVDWDVKPQNKQTIKISIKQIEMIL